MKQRTLGKTGLKVTELSLGGLFVSSYGANFEQAKAAVHRAVDLGVNYIDTAPGYGNSEEVLGKILVDIKKPLILSTKFGGRPQPFKPQDRACLMQSFEESLKLLNRDYIDLMMIHEPDRPGQYDWWTNYDKAEGPVLDLLHDLKKKGLIKYIGLGGTTTYEMTRLVKTGKFDVLLTAFNYSLLWREAEWDLLPEAKKQGMGVIVGSPLQQGSLARRWEDEIKKNPIYLSPPRRDQFLALYKYLDEINLPIAEAGLRFVLSNPDIACTLMGARSKEEVEANVAAAGKGPLPADVLKKLNEIAKMVPFSPRSEPFGIPFGNDAYKGPGLPY